jgi:hypothetical protein
MPIIPCRLSAIAAIACLLAACGGPADSAGTSGGTGVSSGNNPPPNVVAATIDSGPGASPGSVDTLFVSVTVCAPGTALCQTIDHVQVDTGSTGFRVLAEVLGGGVTSGQLQQATDGSGSPLVECVQFADGYSWGPIKLADLKIGGKTAASIPIQVIGDPTYASRTIPSACSSFVDVPENSLAQLGVNGILGIGNFIEDCGSYCASGAQDGSVYNVCPEGMAPACQPAAVALAAQVQNPAAIFASDNNGVLIQLPAVAAPGASTATGNLVFGVDTASNNALGKATVYALDSAGNVGTAVTGLHAFSSSFIDSGSNGYFFDDASLQLCPGDNSSFYCPPGPTSFSATITGTNGATGAVGFTVDNAASDFKMNAAALPNLAGSAGTGLGTDTFDWGLPFFYGRSVYVVFEGRTALSSSLAGPYVAF